MVKIEPNEGFDMRINFTPNFKASFSNDSETTKVLKAFESKEGAFPVQVAKNALKDIDVKDVIALQKYEDGVYIASNDASKRRMYLGRNENLALNMLLDAIFDKSYSLFSERKGAPKSKHEYVNALAASLEKSGKSMTGLDFFDYN